MSYWDTSALAKLYVKEADSAVFEQYLIGLTNQNVPQLNPPTICRIGLFEIQAVFHRKESEQVLPAGAAGILAAKLEQDVASGKIRLIEMSASVEQEYGRILSSCYGRKPFIPLRSLDAIHLASARISSEAEIVTTDSRMRDAAKVLGFSLFPK